MFCQTAESDAAEGIRGLPQRLSTTAAAVTFVGLTMFSSILLIWRGGSSALWVTIPAGTSWRPLSAIAAGWLIKRSPDNDLAISTFDAGSRVDRARFPRSSEVGQTL
jgi:hypothetical protein